MILLAFIDSNCESVEMFSIGQTEFSYFVNGVIPTDLFGIMILNYIVPTHEKLNFFSMFDEKKKGLKRLDLDYTGVMNHERI